MAANSGANDRIPSTEANAVAARKHAIEPMIGIFATITAMIAMTPLNGGTAIPKRLEPFRDCSAFGSATRHSSNALNRSWRPNS